MVFSLISRRNSYKPTEPMEPPIRPFSIYLLPTLVFPFTRRREPEPTQQRLQIQNQHRRQSSTSTSTTTSSTSAASDGSTNQHASVIHTPLTTPATSPITTNFPPEHQQSTTPGQKTNSKPPRARHEPSKTLIRVRPDTLRCRTCATDFALASQIISKGFTGRQGRAYLVSPPSTTTPFTQPLSPTSPSSLSSSSQSQSQCHQPPPSIVPSQSESEATQNLTNIKVGRPEGRALVTGWHEVADITCRICGETVGWKYVDARDEAQRYKVGKFILETAQTVRFSSWEDFGGDDGGMGTGVDVGGLPLAPGVREAREGNERDKEREGKRKLSATSSSGPEGEDHSEDDTTSEKCHDAQENHNDVEDEDIRELDHQKTPQPQPHGDDWWFQQIGDTGTAVPIIDFDSSDEDECDDIFAGVWDPLVVARRRRFNNSAHTRNKRMRSSSGSNGASSNNGNNGSGSGSGSGARRGESGEGDDAGDTGAGGGAGDARGGAEGEAGGGGGGGGGYGARNYVVDTRLP